MQRYLLFDAGCAMCTQMAQDLDAVSKGWFTARSLRDEEMQTLLKRAKPDWKWEPTLLEVKGTKVRAYTGLKMRARVAAGVGPRRAWEMAKIVYGQQIISEGTPAVPARRKFLGRAGVLAGIVAIPEGSILPSSRSKRKDGIELVRPLSKEEATSFTQLALSSASLEQFRTLLFEKFGDRFRIREDHADVLEVPNQGVVAVRFTIEGGEEHSVYTLCYNKISLEEIDSLYAIYHSVGIDQLKVYAGRGRDRVFDAVISPKGKLINGTLHDKEVISDVSRQSVGFLECFSCCFASAGLSQAVILVISIVCGGLCATGAGCVLCIAGLAAVSNGVLNICAVSCTIEFQNCCTERCLL